MKRNRVLVRVALNLPLQVQEIIVPDGASIKDFENKVEGYKKPVAILCNAQEVDRNYQPKDKDMIFFIPKMTQEEWNRR